MVKEAKDRVVNTDRKVEEQDYKREPHERDESPDGQGVKPRGVIQQAASDLEQGLVDTEARGTPGIDKAVEPKPGATGQADPQPERHRDMRDHDAAASGDGGKNR